MECFYWFIFSSYTYWSYLFFCVYLFLNALKIKNYLKINILIINYKMDIEPLQIKIVM